MIAAVDDDRVITVSVHLFARIDWHWCPNDRVSYSDGIPAWMCGFQRGISTVNLGEVNGSGDHRVLKPTVRAFGQNLGHVGSRRHCLIWTGRGPVLAGGGFVSGRAPMGVSVWGIGDFLSDRWVVSVNFLTVLSAWIEFSIDLKLSDSSSVRFMLMRR